MTEAFGTDRAAASPPPARLAVGRRITALARQVARSEGPLRPSRSLFRRGGTVVKTEAQPVVLLPYSSGGGPRPPTHRKLLWATFFVFVVLPTVTALCYFAFVASRQYVSETKFVVRGATQAMPGQGMSLGAIGMAFRLNNNQEGAIVSSYIQSEGMVKDLAERVDLMHIYGRPEIDWLSRLPSAHPYEEATRYWLKMASVDTEIVSGILTLKVSAFSPQEAQLIATLVLQRCDELVNEMLLQARNDAVASAELELRRSMVEAATARAAFEQLRDTERLIDATGSAGSLLSLETKLREQKIEIETQLTTLKARLSEDALAIREANNRLHEIDRQVGDLQSRLVNANDRDNSISDSIRLYEHRKFDLGVAEGNQDFADRLLANAQRESELRHVFIDPYQTPTVAVKATYPHRVADTLRFGGRLLILWLIGALLFVRIAEHTD